MVNAHTEALTEKPGTGTQGEGDCGGGRGLLSGSKRDKEEMKQVLSGFWLNLNSSGDWGSGSQTGWRCSFRMLYYGQWTLRSLSERACSSGPRCSVIPVPWCFGTLHSKETRTFSCQKHPSTALLGC